VNLPDDSSGPVLFDLDGTLTASGPGILASVRHALTELGEQVPEPEVLQAFIGPPLVDSFQQLCGMDPDRAWTAVLTYRDYFAARGQFENSVYDGIPELLAALRADGRELAVATSKAEVFAHSILAHFGLADHFAAVVGSELDGRRTAKAEIIGEALARLGRPPAGAVMLGDRSHDVVGASTVGIPCIGALWGYGTAEELESAGAVALAAAPDDVLGLLGGGRP
jgi:phosphoglycolate phosphatase